MGWAAPSHLPTPFPGVAGTAHPRVLTRQGTAFSCPHELPLFARERERLLAIGDVKAGARFVPSSAIGGYTRVSVIDPDVQEADGVSQLVLTSALGGCGAVQ